MFKKKINRREALKSAALFGLSMASFRQRKTFDFAGLSDIKPNILWIMTDDQRIDSLGCYGSKWARTPNIDSIAASGTLFRNAVSQSTVCHPSRSSILSGKYCHSIGMMENPDRSKKGTFPLTREFADQGYQVTNIGKLGAHIDDYAMFDNHIPSPGYGGPAATPYRLKNEFEGMEKKYSVLKLPTKYPEQEPPIIIAGTYPLPEEQTEHGINATRAIDFIEKNISEPFFMRVSMISPHSPVLPPRPYDTMFDPKDMPIRLPSDKELNSLPDYEKKILMPLVGSAGKLSEFEIRKAWASYYGLAASVDHQVGRIMRTLKKEGLLDKTIIVFTTDQGVQMGEHGFFMKRCFYEETVLCPLIFSWPGIIPEGKKVTGQVELIDILPTLIELAGLSVPDGVHGRSLLPVFEGNESVGRDQTFSEIDYSLSGHQFARVSKGRRVMVRTEEWKLVYFIDREEPDGSLYNLLEDPGEHKNLYRLPKYKDIIRRLESIAREWDDAT